MTLLLHIHLVSNAHLRQVHGVGKSGGIDFSAKFSPLALLRELFISFFSKNDQDFYYTEIERLNLAY